ncbi:HET-C domain protein [Pyronema omphalodes]|nr:HET-C domain protein [Pyronema omphalodes]
MSSTSTPFLILLGTIVLLALVSPSHAFGAGNIASIAKIEGHNFRHGDIEDTLKEIGFLYGAKWTSAQVRRVYFGNWLRDYSQALDVGTLKSVPKDTIRCLVWILAFMSFGYATGEYEVTEERLGVYRPEEHIDNPKDYADNTDARVYDPRLRAPVHPHELAIDPLTGMKNYIANETGGWATSSGYVKFSLTRAIHYGRMYTSGGGNESDLCEALRCLGQALHCLEDFSAHSNYVELVLREIGFRSVFPHVGEATEMEIGVPPGYGGGKRAFPLVTGTFGSVDFAHSVLGEAQDKFSQTEVEEMDVALMEAHDEQKRSEKSGEGSILKDLLKQLNAAGVLGGAGDAARDIDRLEEESDAQEMANMRLGPDQARSSSFNPIETIQKIYPILEFRDRIMRSIEAALEKIPGLMTLVEKIQETMTIFVLSLLAPYIRPLIARASLELKEGSTAVIDSSAQHQFEPWTDPYCTDPTHSLLSKDHFSNKLNTPAGEVASAVLTYVVPRILHAWEDPSFPVEVVLNDVARVFHHPALRDPNCDIQAGMFSAVVSWTERLPDRGASLNDVLSAAGVKAGKNHTGGVFGGCHGGGHGKTAGGEWAKAKKAKDKKKGKKEDNILAGIPGIAASGGNIKIGGVQLPGVLGGVLDAGLQGFMDAQGRTGGRSGSGFDPYEREEKKEKKEKKKDKYKEEDYEYGGKKHKEEKYKEDKYGGEKYKEDKYKEDKYKEDKRESRDHRYHHGHHSPHGNGGYDGYGSGAGGGYY